MKEEKLILKVIDFVRAHALASFAYYRQGVFYYTVADARTYDPVANYGDFYIFPIPAADLGDATINQSEKTIFLMRYIRQALDDGTMVKYKTENGK